MASLTFRLTNILHYSVLALLVQMKALNCNNNIITLPLDEEREILLGEVPIIRFTIRFMLDLD